MLCFSLRPALAVQIARVGNNSPAERFIHLLDVDPEIGDVVDCIHRLSFWNTKHSSAEANLYTGIKRRENRESPIVVETGGYF